MTEQKIWKRVYRVSVINAQGESVPSLVTTNELNALDRLEDLQILHGEKNAEIACYSAQFSV